MTCAFTTPMSKTSRWRISCASFSPHLVGITTNTPQVKQAWRTAAAIKQELDIPIVLGGPHVSVVSEDLDFESLRQPQVDLVVRGEGEGPWIEISDIVDAFLRDQPAFSADGVDGPRARPLPRGQERELQDQRRRSCIATPTAR